MNRRNFVKTGVLGGAALAAGSLVPRPLRAIDQAAAISPPTTGGAGIEQIEHIVVFIQENRSFDHYFGTFPGARGFDDAPDAVLKQPGWSPNSDGRLYPYHFDTRSLDKDGWCVNDISHEWDVVHKGWNHGAMDQQLRAHVDANGEAIAPVCMGYYNGRDLKFYHALAAAFTLLDGYHCSVLGPTDPNRLMSMTATIDPDGSNGGPILKTGLKEPLLGTLTWKTMPEVLEDAGISWKVYETPDDDGTDNILPYFKNYQDPTSPLFQKGIAPTFPADFLADVAAGTLPKVSWVIANVAQSEHPGAAPPQGELAAYQILEALVANPAIWAKTALIITYDEHGGFFDHISPPTAPQGTPGEWLTTNPLPADAMGIAGPIGLGMRVPCIIASPFAKGGRIVSDTFDHTSILKFIAKRFGLQVPNISAWRDSHVGDLTTAFNFAQPPSAGPVWLPPPEATNPATLKQCATNGGTGTADMGDTYPVPVDGPRPSQGGQWETA